jgi:hypothetical protein
MRGTSLRQAGMSGRDMVRGTSMESGGSHRRFHRGGHCKARLLYLSGPGAPVGCHLLSPPQMSTLLLWRSTPCAWRVLCGELGLEECIGARVSRPRDSVGSRFQGPENTPAF